MRALRDTRWQQETQRQLARSGERMRALLHAHGIAAQGTALFQWWPEAHPEAMHEHLAQRGIWSRLFRDAARGMRLGLPPDAEGWRRLNQALLEWRTQ